MKFVKMQGCGNDYVYLDAVSDPSISARMADRTWVRLVKNMSDRHKGIGSDGVIAVCVPTPEGKRKGAQARMRMFNADGSESEMCGNGVRCVAKFAHDRLGLGNGREIRIQTGAGVLPIAVELKRGRVVRATVDMGKPVEGLKACHVTRGKLAFEGAAHHWGVERDGIYLIGTFVSMGNPHMVVFEPHDESKAMSMTPREVRATNLEWLGPIFEKHPAFAKRINVHFAGVESGRGLADRVVMRTWERGAGITQACGTGACAVVVAGVLTGRTKRDVEVDLPGGRLHVRWDKKTSRVFMSGPCEDVFEGVWKE